MKSEMISLWGISTRNLIRYADDTLDENAMCELGYRYMAGKKVRRNTGKSIMWYMMSAEYGNAYACYVLGQIAEIGMKNIRGDDMAFHWYSMGAGIEQPECLNQLGIMYAEGISVDPDEEAAVELFTKAAELGNECARDNLQTIKEKIDRPFFGINLYD